MFEKKSDWEKINEVLREGENGDKAIWVIYHDENDNIRGVGEYYQRLVVDDENNDGSRRSVEVVFDNEQDARDEFESYSSYFRYDQKAGRADCEEYILAREDYLYNTDTDEYDIDQGDFLEVSPLRIKCDECGEMVEYVGGLHAASEQGEFTWNGDFLCHNCNGHGHGAKYDKNTDNFFAFYVTCEKCEKPGLATDAVKVWDAGGECHFYCPDCAPPRHECAAEHCYRQIADSDAKWFNGKSYCPDCCPEG